MTCLVVLIQQRAECTIEVIVVANGCTDRTADLARDFSAQARDTDVRLHVLEIDEASKSAALNAGEEHAADSDVRMYLDADSRLSENCIQALLDTLREEANIHECCPRAEAEESRGWISRQYSCIWSRIPRVAADVWGKGCIAVDRDGRSRWSTFPQVVADEGFVHLHFERNERCVVGDAWVRVQVPDGLRELVSVRSRWVRGEQELLAAHSELKARRGALPRKSVPTLLPISESAIPREILHRTRAQPLRNHAAR